MFNIPSLETEIDNLKWVDLLYSQRDCIPNEEGVYLFKIIEDDNERVVYVGQSIMLKNRLTQHFSFASLILSELPSSKILVISFALTDRARKIEKLLIGKFKPLHNGVSKNKDISNIVGQIRKAMDGRKLRWLSINVGITEQELSKKMSGKMEWKDEELKAIEDRLNFKIEK